MTEQLSDQSSPLPASTKTAVGALGLSLGFMLLHFVLNTLRNKSICAPVGSQLLVGLFLLLLIGLVRRQRWAWKCGRATGIVVGILMIGSACVALRVLASATVDEVPEGLYVTLAIMLLQPWPLLVLFFALGRKESRELFDVPRRPCTKESQTQSGVVSWTCPGCGEQVPETFDVCWKCQTPAGKDEEQTEE
jgi:hypothetical protein